jgi:inorganic pyrophosphatase
MYAATSKQLLSLPEVAILLGVSRDTVRRAVRAGSLEPVRLREGGHPRFRVADVERLIEDGPRNALDRVYPVDYGFVQGTVGEDGDPLDALVLVGDPTFPGCVIRGRVVGVFHMTDEKGADDKLVCVPLGDPIWTDVRDVASIPQALCSEIEQFFRVYKELEGKPTRTPGFGDRAEALRVLNQARARSDRAGRRTKGRSLTSTPA